MSKKQGFTLLVILVAMLIIGFVAGKYFMDVFGTKKETISPKAVIPLARVSRIVSDLNALKTASISYYAESSSWPETIDQLQHITGRTGLEEKGYQLQLNSWDASQETLYILKDMSEELPEVKEGLAQKSGNLSLFGTDGPDAADGNTIFSGTEKFVYILLVAH